MSVFSQVRQVMTGGDEESVVIECRQCGTTLDTMTKRCPECGRDDVVTITIS
mgnify:FL=1